MDVEAVGRVRSFQRTVTQRIGVLHDEYLARGRTLGASRVLWEVGPDGCDVRTLRARLDLDSGYLSRLLRALEAENLVTTEADPADKRVRTVRLTDAGALERKVLDQSSDEVAWALLTALNDGQRARLVEAMGTVERLLTAGLVEIAPEDAAGADAQRCLAAYYSELGERFDDGFDPGLGLPAGAPEMSPPSGVFLVGRLRGEAIACGGLKLHGRDPAEIKRMWVAPSARGLGVARRLLSALEDQARSRGIATLRLETNRNLREAIAMYRSAGFVEIAPYNDEHYAHHWFEKPLDPTDAPT
jgi:GNAT superfamily N-acetyltransferase/DNA-binding MarR family transcriptional regulator